MMTVPMECHCIRPAEIPHTTKLFATFLEDFSRLAGFYAHPPTEEGILQAARALKNGAGHAETRRTVVEVLVEQNQRFGADGATRRNLDRLAAGAVAVVTGQQVGLFTGPCYSIYKAATALRIARQLTEHGTEAVPVFWLAGEDHDLAEVNHCFWPARNALERLQAPAASSAGQPRSVGRIELGPGIRAVVTAAAAALEGPAAEEIGRALEQSYRPEQTFGSAFGRLMGRLFAGQGIILLDPLDARLHGLAAPIYRRAVEEDVELTRELLARSKALESAGYHSQVKITDRSTVLFLNLDGQRLPLRKRHAGFAAGSREFSASELLDAAGRTPEMFSANVLLRPVVQDYLLPTAAYVGGPAEVAYYAQVEVLYRRLLGRMPAVLPRASFTLVEPHLARLLNKYGFQPRDVFRGRQHLRARMERTFISKPLAARFVTGEKNLRKLLAGLGQPLGKVDKTLLGALKTAEGRMLYQFDRLRGKAARAENFRTGVLDAHERQIVDSLYPRHGLQERTWCALPLLARQGLGLLEELIARAGIGSTQHQVLYC